MMPNQAALPKLERYVAMGRCLHGRVDPDCETVRTRSGSTLARWVGVL